MSDVGNISDSDESELGVVEWDEEGEGKEVDRMGWVKQGRLY